MKLNFWFLFLTLIAEILGTVGGFGSSVFFVPIGNFYFDFHSVLSLTALLHLSSNISKIFLFKKGLNKQLLVYIGAPAVLFVIIGGYLSTIFNSRWFELSLSLFLILISALFLIKRKFEIKPTPRNSILGGAFSGFTAGLLGTGGAIRGLTMAAFNLEKSIFITTSAFIDLAVDFTRTIVYYRNGYIHHSDLKYIPFLFVIGLVGSYIGKQVLQYVPQKRFKRISLSLILLIGIATMIKFFLS